MAAGIKRPHGETERHARLKRLAFYGRRPEGYSACAMEVSLPKCRYRADVAAYRLTPKRGGNPQRFLSVNRHFAICGEIIARAKMLACNSRRFANAASFSKGASAHTIRACETVIPYFPNSICMTSPRSVTVVTREFCVSCVPCNIVSMIAPSSTNYFAIVARICISSFYLSIYSAIRRFLPAGALLSKPTVCSSSCVNQSGTKQRPSIMFGFCTESPWLGHAQLIKN